MARAPYNVLVIPYYIEDGEIKYCIMLREDMKVWQFVAGGGEDDESPIIAAKRETFEETGIREFKSFQLLETKTYVPTRYFKNAKELWGNKYVIPVHCFSVETFNKDIVMSKEHLDCKWVTHEEAESLLHFDVDKTCIYELDCILEQKYNLKNRN